MKTAIASLIILSSLSLSALADELPRHRQCEVRDLSLAQRTELQKIKLVAEEKIKPLRAELKAARDLQNRILQNPRALKAEADAVQLDIGLKSAAVKAILAESKMIELFDILSAEQRVKKTKCQAAVKNPQGPGRVIISRPDRLPNRYQYPYSRYGRSTRVGRGHPMPHRPYRPHRRVFP